MKKILAAVSLGAIAVLGSQFVSAQVEPTDEELFILCSKFPKNSKCKGIEVPISLKERRGEEVGCSFRFDPSKFNQKGACKLITDKTGITVYKEHGNKSEALDEKRATSATKIQGDRIFSFNHQVWNKTHRWEIGFLPDENSQTENDTNFVVILVGEKQAESISNQIKSFAFTQPELIDDLITNSFVDANLQGANLSFTNINRVDFENANLTNTNFAESSIDLEDLEELELCGVTLADGTKSDRDCS